MRRDLLPNLVIVLGIMLLPLVWVPHRLMHPAPWVAMAVGLVLLFSQPPLERKETVSPTAEDRLSALGIYGAMVTAQLVSVMDFGFVRREGPEAASPLWVGAVVCTIAGLAFRIWAIRTLGRFFTANVRLLAGHRVVDDGPYSLVRHPSYTGAILTALGLAGCFGSGWGALAVAALMLPAYAHRISIEERALVAGLGEAYERYRQRTRRLIPYVY